MGQPVFNWIWLGLTAAIIVVRKVHERRAGKRPGFGDTPLPEAALMAAWGAAAGVLPLFYVFGPWLRFADYPFPWPAAAGWIGAALFVGSIWLLHRSHADLGKRWSPAVEPEGGQGLVTGGVYRRIRHPMYTAHVAWGLAQGLLLPNVLAGPLPLLLIAAVLVLRIPREERAMLERFGDEYRAYQKRTGRILPRLRSP